MSRPKVLIAGIGNIFLGDDGFGVEAVQRLRRRPLPEGVQAVDFGIRGFDLAFAILDGCDVAILVDALPRGEPPGTLYVLEPEREGADRAGPVEIETHGMHPARVLDLVDMFGGTSARILVVGCEPLTFGPEGEGQMGLSPPVAAAVDEALGLIESLVMELCAAELGA